MTPIQLLKATQAAIGNGKLAEEQEEIIKIQKESSTSVRDLDAARASLELKRTENLQREKEVERIREHEARQTETKNLQKRLLWVEFEDSKKEAKRLKDRKIELKRALDVCNSSRSRETVIVLVLVRHQ